MGCPVNCPVFGCARPFKDRYAMMHHRRTEHLAAEPPNGANFFAVRNYEELQDLGGKRKQEMQALLGADFSRNRPAGHVSVFM